MRGDQALHARLLLRPAGIVGLVMMLAGLTTLASAYLPWYEVRADMAVLGTSGQWTVAELAGWQAHPWGWIVPVLGLTSVVAGAALSIDRPLDPRTPLAAGAGIALAVAISGLRFPPVDRFDVAGSGLREMLERSGQLPSDVVLEFSVHAAIGMWLTLSAAVLVVAAGLAARQQ